MFMNKLTPRKCIDFNWKIFHGQVNTENKLKNMHFSTGLCSLCQYQNENLNHLLIECEKVYAVWQKIESIIKEIAIFTGKEFVFTRFNMMVGYLKEGFEYDIVNMVLSISRWIIWKRRCINRYDKRYIELQELEKWIKSEIVEHIEVLLTIRSTKHKELLKEIKESIY